MPCVVEQGEGLFERQADHVRSAAGDTEDESASRTLERVAAGLVEGFTESHILDEFSMTGGAHRHLARDDPGEETAAGTPGYGHTRHDAMAGSHQSLEQLDGVILVPRFSEDILARDDDRVGPEYDPGRSCGDPLSHFDRLLTRQAIGQLVWRLAEPGLLVDP